MVTIALALVLFFALPPQSPTVPDQQHARVRAEQDRQQAVELNLLAGQIHSDVDAIADIFADQLPPAWVTAAIRERVARAEYEAVNDPARLIPEQRVAEVWNEYVREIGAPEETLITSAEIHWMRDAHFASGQLVWARGTTQSIWTMPNIYPSGPDGKVASGCRPVELLRTMWDLDNLFENVRMARERMRRGILTSDVLKQQLEHPNPPPKTAARLVVGLDINPVRPAERHYVQEHGLENYYLLLEKLFNELFPE